MPAVGQLDSYVIPVAELDENDASTIISETISDQSFESMYDVLPDMRDLSFGNLPRNVTWNCAHRAGLRLAELLPSLRLLTSTTYCPSFYLVQMCLVVFMSTMRIEESITNLLQDYHDTRDKIDRCRMLHTQDPSSNAFLRQPQSWEQFCDETYRQIETELEDLHETTQTTFDEYMPREFFEHKDGYDAYIDTIYVLSQALFGNCDAYEFKLALEKECKELHCILDEWSDESISV